MHHGPIEPISPGDVITAEWLNRVAAVGSQFPTIHGKGYADSNGAAFATGRGSVALPFIGKPKTSFANGHLVAPDNVLIVWTGLLAGETLAATTEEIEIDYSAGDFTSVDLVAVTPMDGGALVASCFPGGGA